VVAFWKSHFSTGTRSAYAASSFDPRLLLQAPDALIPALVGLAFVVRCRRWELLSPFTLFVTALLVHTFHRPYWPYYYIHFAIALSWSASIGLGYISSTVWQYTWADLSQLRLKRSLSLLIWSALVSLIPLEAPQRMRFAIDELLSVEDVASNEAVQQMKKYRTQTRWAFTDRVIYAFHAGILVPPELAVIPEKRVWSGEISSMDVLAALRVYRPEQIWIFGSVAAQEIIYHKEILDLLRSNYIRKKGAIEAGFYLSKDLRDADLAQELAPTAGQ
jgi:hypothetical protein